MEAVVLFLIKSVGSGLLGHYLKKLLEGIDPQLEKMIARGASPKDIITYVDKHNLNKEVERLVKTVVQESVIVPTITGHMPTLATRTEFFGHFIEIGFLLSSTWKADLLVRGTFFGSNGFMAFCAGPGKAPVVTRVGVTAQIKADLGRGLYIVPLRDEGLVSETWIHFKELLRRAKGDSDDYIELRHLEAGLRNLIDRCDVVEFSAMTITYRWLILLRSRKELALSFSKSDKEDIGDWKSGLECFVQSVVELRDLFMLPETEFETIRSLTSRLATFLEPRA
jgi:hypothetical protein